MKPLACLLLLSPGAALADDFVGAYAPANWQSSGISGGSAEVDLIASDAEQLVLTYNVNLGASTGVSRRTALFTVTADQDANVSFDWTYSLHHAWFLAEADLVFFAYDSAGVRHDVVAFDEDTYDQGNASGVGQSLTVVAGQPWGVEVGGANFDSSSWIRGTVTLTGLVIEELDCEGVLGGPATEDMCGTCDDDPTNDCVEDCAGAWGGAAAADMCGTCDDDPTNDCVEDCAGVWGGAAAEDACGACDEDASNDCVQDCYGDWGGAAAVDACGTCSGGNTGVEVDDCGPVEAQPVTGCACAQGGSGGGALWLGPLLVVVGRRRRG